MKALDELIELVDNHVKGKRAEPADHLEQSLDILKEWNKHFKSYGIGGFGIEDYKAISARTTEFLKKHHKE